MALAGLIERVGGVFVAFLLLQLAGAVVAVVFATEIREALLLLGLPFRLLLEHMRHQKARHVPDRRG